MLNLHTKETCEKRSRVSKVIFLPLKSSLDAKLRVPLLLLQIELMFEVKILQLVQQKSNLDIEESIDCLTKKGLFHRLRRHNCETARKRRFTEASDMEYLGENARRPYRITCHL